MRCFLIISLLLSPFGGFASTEAAWESQFEKFKNECFLASNFKNPKAITKVITFDDDLGIQALLIEGNYPQKHMKNQKGKILCLFNQKTQKIYTSALEFN